MAKQLNKHTPKSDELFKRLESNDSGGLDDFEKEALEGFASLENNEQARTLNSKLDAKLNETYFEKKSGNRTLYYLSMAAGLVLLIGLSILFYNILGNQKEELAINKETPLIEVLPDQLAAPGASDAQAPAEEEQKKSELKEEPAKLNEQQAISESKPNAGSISKTAESAGPGFASGTTRSDVAANMSTEKDIQKPNGVYNGPVTAAAPVVMEEKNQLAGSGVADEGEKYNKVSADKDLEDTKARSTVLGGMKKSAGKSEPKRKEKSAAPSEAIASDDREYSAAPTAVAAKAAVAKEEESIVTPSFKYKSFNRAQDYIKSEIDKNEKLKNNIKEFIAKVSINETGKVTKVKFLSSFTSCSECESILETIIMNMPNWNPAQLSGKSVKETIHFVYP